MAVSSPTLMSSDGDAGSPADGGHGVGDTEAACVVVRLIVQARPCAGASEAGVAVRASVDVRGIELESGVASSQSHTVGSGDGKRVEG